MCIRDRCVDALNGAPGIYSARYGGVDSDQARYRLLLENLRGAGARTAHFHTAIVCCFPNGDRLDAAGDCFEMCIRDSFWSRGW